MYKRILVPTDGSEFAQRAEHIALEIAKSMDAEIFAISVIENSFVNGLPLDEEVFELTSILKQDSEKNIEDFEHMDEEENFNVKITSIIKEGSPAKEILTAAEEEDIDLIVVGSSGKSKLDKFLMGSVADKVSKHAHCSVLVVR
ncbi:MAG: universal stress protein [Methanobrevibacter sp.]|uniref:universal stress protein n=1 Tax=Methanobrevibacter sp. TaxID=66852 RepID=UPI0026DEE814|nr:universal stress protein [Methanobrevibacter sp.]MDO5848946.1 universal stress protein [Methanobrevibacter sp.]